MPKKTNESKRVHCRYSGKLCLLFGRCDWFCLGTGNVDVCSSHGNVSGRFTPTKFELSRSGFQ